MRSIVKLIIVLLLVCSMGVSGCAYKEAYGAYAQAQASMAMAAGPLFKQSLTPDGKVASFEVGNPLTAMAMMQMKAPKSEWESFVEWLKVATPFAAIWGVAGSLSGHGSTSTNVSGTGNFVGNQAGNGAQWASPTTTTTVTETIMSGVE